MNAPDITKSNDFKAYFCQKQQRHIWVLGYFGGGSINFIRYKEIAEFFAHKAKVPIETIEMDEIFKSRRFKGFKFIFSTHDYQEPIKAYGEKCDDVFKWLND